MGKNNSIGKPKKNTLGRRMFKVRELYILLIPAFVSCLLFKYYPMYGLQLAFKSMKLGQTFQTAKWVGMKNFERFFSTGMFARTVKNTLAIGVSTVLIFPIPIILALLLHNCVNKGVRKITQSVTYIPYLVSVAVTMSIVLLFCNGSTGFLNLFAKRLGRETINYMGKDKYVLPLYIISEIWSTTGFNCVIYIAALSGVSMELVEASQIDGCSKLKKMWYIDLPAIAPTIAILLIMSLGKFFAASTEKMLILQNDMNIAASETIGTYTYKLGFTGSPQYGYSAAVDLFSNVVNFVMLIISNTISKRISGSSLF